MCCFGSNQQYVFIGSDNGMAPNRRQAIIWTNDRLESVDAYICYLASMS